MTKQTLLRTRVAHFISDPSQTKRALQYLDDAIIAFENGRVSLLEPTAIAQQEGIDITQAEHLPDALLLPGFIDAHVHAPQLPVMGRYGKQLLAWLNSYTFPAEQRFADVAYSQGETDFFIGQLLANGTTTAMVYTTSFGHSTTHLFECAAKINMRLIGGNVLMDCGAPTALLNHEDYIRTSHDLIERWHGYQRLGYALTPRFAGTSTHSQLQAAGQLLRAHPSIWLQTHLSETRDEVSLMASRFPDASDYLDIYERHGLHHNKTVFGHGIHLTTSERQRIGEMGSSIAFCPSANLFLGSGLFDLTAAHDKNINVVLGSDVGAGTSLCMLSVMADGYKVGQLQDYSLSSQHAFYMASLGAAKALGLDEHIGNLLPGKEADAILIEKRHHPLVAHRLASTTTIDDELFAYMTLGDNRLISRTYIDGCALHDSYART